MKRFALLSLTLLAVVALTTVAFGQGTLTFKAEMTGAEEVPPVSTAATGTVRLQVNSERTQIAFDLDIRDATNILGAAGAHLHCGTRGTNGPIVAFFAGVVTGGLDGRIEIKGTLNVACDEFEAAQRDVFSCDRLPRRVLRSRARVRGDRLTWPVTDTAAPYGLRPAGVT